MDDVIHEPAHEMHPQAPSPPLARQPSEIHAGRQARGRGAPVFQLDPQRMGPRQETEPNGVTRLASVGVFDHVRHGFSHRHRNLVGGGRIEALGERRSPSRLMHEAQALAGRRHVNLEWRPFRPQWLNALQN